MNRSQFVELHERLQGFARQFADWVRLLEGIMSCVNLQPPGALSALSTSHTSLPAQVWAVELFFSLLPVVAGNGVPAGRRIHDAFTDALHTLGSKFIAAEVQLQKRLLLAVVAGRREAAALGC